jgi:uncharacterized membrane protein (DUF485 family)
MQTVENSGRNSSMAGLFKEFKRKSTFIKTLSMGNLLYIIAVILIIGWLLGMFAFHVTGGLIHLVLVIAIILIILQVVNGRRRI